MTIVYLNGEFMPAAEARISPLDRGFLFADGVYEVVPVFNGTPLRLQQHLRRLERSLQELRMDKPATREALASLVTQMIARNGGGNLAVYLQITRGAPERRDHGFPQPPARPTVFMTTSPIGATAVDELERTTGASAITAEDVRWLRCDIKSVALLPNVLLRQHAIELQAIEAILLRGDQVTEGTSTNVFVVKQGRIATPPLGRLILAGTTRELTLELCRAHELPVEERAISSAELFSADEVWVTSSTKDVLPIVQLDGARVGTGRPGALWKVLAAHYREYKRKHCANASAADTAQAWLGMARRQPLS